MALDKETVKRIATQSGIKESKSRHFMRDGKKFAVSECSDKGLEDFAQAIYALGVADERERLAQWADAKALEYEGCTEEEWAYQSIAEAIRKGE